MTDARPPAGHRTEGLVRWAPPLVVLMFFASTAHGYGVFRDELYYFACGRHLDWGYVDHPPMIAVLAALVRVVFGDSWLAARVVSAVAAAGTVLLVGDTTRELGGGRWARLLAQLLCATAPVYLALFSIFSMNAFDILVWAALLRIAARILAGGNARLWLVFGVVAGFGLLNKLDVGLLGAGLGIGLVLAWRLDVLRSPWIWIGGAIAVALFLPHVIWQAHHGWPTREFVANAQRAKIAYLGPLGFVAAQFRDGPVGFTLAIAGLGWLLVAPRGRPFRALGWAILAVLVVFATSVSKPYYFSPALTGLFPAAAVVTETWTRGRFARPVRAAVMVLVALILVGAPLAKPLLSEDGYVTYAAALGIKPSAGGERHRLGRLPQFFADMHGWRELSEAVAGIVAKLPPDERAQVCVYGGNYGEAGAIDFYRSTLDLPPAISGHNSYWLWGPGTCRGTVLVIIGGSGAGHARFFERVEAAGVVRCADCMPFEDNLTIWVARGPRAPIDKIWPATRHFN